MELWGNAEFILQYACQIGSVWKPTLGDEVICFLFLQLWVRLNLRWFWVGAKPPIISDGWLNP